MNSFVFHFSRLAPLAEAIAEHWDSPVVILGKLAIIVGLVVLNAFFVASRVRDRQGARAASSTRWKMKGTSARFLRSTFAEHLDAYLSATQLGITLASLGPRLDRRTISRALLEPAFVLVGSAFARRGFRDLDHARVYRDHVSPHRLRRAGAEIHRDRESAFGLARGSPGRSALFTSSSSPRSGS